MAVDNRAPCVLVLLFTIICCTSKSFIHSFILWINIAVKDIALNIISHQNLIGQI